MLVAMSSSALGFILSRLMANECDYMFDHASDKGHNVWDRLQELSGDSDEEPGRVTTPTLASLEEEAGTGAYIKRIQPPDQPLMLQIPRSNRIRSFPRSKYRVKRSLLI